MSVATPSSKLQAPSSKLQAPSFLALSTYRRFSKRAWPIHLMQLSAVIYWSSCRTLSRADYVPNPEASPAWSMPPIWDNNGSEPAAGPDLGNHDYDLLPDWYEDAIGTDRYNPDTDGDGITDSDELTITLTNPLLADTNGNGWTDYEDWSGSSAPTADPDNDGANNQEEFAAGTDPRNPDSDGDGLLDGFELNSGGLYSPTNTDTNSNGLTDYNEAYGIQPPPTPVFPLDSDGDGLTDDQEAVHGTNIYNSDTDGDGLTDGFEVTWGSSPTNPDSDNDGLSDATEYSLGTNPNNPDSDGDGLTDGFEHDFNGGSTYNPLLTDTNSDGLTDYQDYTGQTPPPSPSDADHDGIPDDQEANYGTDPNNADSDGDGLNDGLEVSWTSSPTNADSDGDGLGDAQEYALSLNPNNPDTDGDGLTDGYEVNTSGTNPALADTDGDGLSDGYELTYCNPPTNPLDPDTDHDFVTDFEEINASSAFPGYNKPLNPNLADSDGNGVSDYMEITSFLADTDGGGIPDRIEIFYGLNPHDPSDDSGDLDGDGVTNLQEYQAGYSLNSDYGNSFDTDLDGMTNVWEIAHGLDPMNPLDCADDPDGDWATNLEEFRLNTDPNSPDSGKSGTTSNGVPLVRGPNADQSLADWDQDGRSNAAELLNDQTNPSEPDTAPKAPPSFSPYGDDGGGDGDPPPPDPCLCNNGNACGTCASAGSCTSNCYTPPPACTCGCTICEYSGDCSAGSCQQACQCGGGSDCHCSAPGQCGSDPDPCKTPCACGATDSTGNPACSCGKSKHCSGTECYTPPPCGCSAAGSGCSCANNEGPCVSSCPSNNVPCGCGASAAGLTCECPSYQEGTTPPCPDGNNCYAPPDPCSCRGVETSTCDCETSADCQDEYACYSNPHCFCPGTDTGDCLCYYASECDNDCDDDSDELTVTLSPAHTKGFTGGDITFTASASGGSGEYTAYDWFFDYGTPNSKTGSSNSESASWSTPGEYSVEVTVTDSDGSTKTTNTSVTIYRIETSTRATAPDNSDSSRTEIGTGEMVELNILDENDDFAQDTSWEECIGGVSSVTNKGPGKAVLTAGSDEETFDVTASISGGVSQTISFTVLRPTGIECVETKNQENELSPERSDSYIELQLKLNPGNVAFNYLTVIEEDGGTSEPKYPHTTAPSEWDVKNGNKLHKPDPIAFTCNGAFYPNGSESWYWTCDWSWNLDDNQVDIPGSPFQQSFDISPVPEGLHISVSKFGVTTKNY